MMERLDDMNDEKVYHGYENRTQRNHGNCLCTATADRLNFEGWECAPRQFQSELSLKYCIDAFVDRQVQYAGLFRAYQDFSEGEFKRLVKSGQAFSLICWDGETCRHVYFENGKAFRNDGFNNEFRIPVEDNDVSKFVVGDMDDYIARLRDPDRRGTYDKFVHDAVVKYTLQHREYTFESLATVALRTYVVPYSASEPLQAEREFITPVLKNV